MRWSHANPRHRRHRRSAIALPAALLALAGAATVPATATAMVDQSTETGTRCIQVMPGVYLALIPGESCEPERPGEVIRIHDPYTPAAPPRPPACSALEHRCGLPDEGRAPHPPREGGFGAGPSRGRGPGAAPTKPKPKSKLGPKTDPAALKECRELESKGKIGVPSGSLPQQVEIAESERYLRSDEKSIQFYLENFLLGALDDWPKDELNDARNDALVMRRRIARLQREIAGIEKARAEWMAKDCRRVLGGR